MRSCCVLGVHFAVDDFGTGYSSLTYLKRLPAELLKIDQTFIRDMLDDLDDLEIVKGVIGLTNAFHRKVIAEGVETIAHGELLIPLGCELAQGYGIARPMPAAIYPVGPRPGSPTPCGHACTNWSKSPPSPRPSEEFSDCIINDKSLIFAHLFALSGDNNNGHSRPQLQPLPTHGTRVGSNDHLW